MATTENAPVVERRQSTSSLYQQQQPEIAVLYITERILVLTFPASSSSSASKKTDDSITTAEETAYRSSLRHVSRMLRTKHGDSYKIFNLSRRRRDLCQYNQYVIEFGWPVHQAPPLERLCALCKDIDGWLNRDAQNIAILHEKPGANRAAMVVAVFMHYCSISASDDQALDRFAMRKFYNEHKVQPSQKRYVNYFAGLLSGQIQINSSPIYLYQIVIYGLPIGSRPYLKFYEKMVPVLTTGAYKVQNPVLTARLQPPLALRGDVLVKCCETVVVSSPSAYSSTAASPSGSADWQQRRPILLFGCQFNTCAVDPRGAPCVSFSARELDLTSNEEAGLDLLYSFDKDFRPVGELATVVDEDSTATLAFRSNSYDRFDRFAEDDAPSAPPASSEPVWTGQSPLTNGSSTTSQQQKAPSERIDYRTPQQQQATLVRQSSANDTADSGIHSVVDGDSSGGGTAQSTLENVIVESQAKRAELVDHKAFAKDRGHQNLAAMENVADAVTTEAYVNKDRLADAAAAVGQGVDRVAAKAERSIETKTANGPLTAVATSPTSEYGSSRAPESAPSESGGQIEFPHRPPPLMAPSRRPFSPQQRPVSPSSLSTGANLTQDGREIDAELVEEGRYDPQSKAFSYVPAKSLEDHFKAPKQQTKLVLKTERTQGVDSNAPPPLTDNDLADLETAAIATPFEPQQTEKRSRQAGPPSSVSTPQAQRKRSTSATRAITPLADNIDHLLDPDFYLNFQDQPSGDTSSMNQQPPEARLPAHQPSATTTKKQPPQPAAKPRLVNGGNEADKGPFLSPEDTAAFDDLVAYGMKHSGGFTEGPSVKPAVPPRPPIKDRLSSDWSTPPAPAAHVPEYQKPLTIVNKVPPHLDTRRGWEPPKRAPGVYTEDDVRWDQVFDDFEKKFIKYPEPKERQPRTPQSAGLSSAAPSYQPQQRGWTTAPPTPVLSSRYQHQQPSAAHQRPLGESVLRALGPDYVDDGWAIDQNRTVAASLPVRPSTAMGFQSRYDEEEPATFVQPMSTRNPYASSPVAIPDTVRKTRSIPDDYGVEYGSAPPGHRARAQSGGGGGDWLSRQMEKLRVRRELNDPILRQRREQERLLLDELRHVHEDRMTKRNRSEADYSVEGVGVRTVEPGSEEDLWQKQQLQQHQPLQQQQPPSHLLYRPQSEQHAPPPEPHPHPRVQSQFHQPPSYQQPQQQPMSYFEHFTSGVSEPNTILLRREIITNPSESPLLAQAAFAGARPKTGSGYPYQTTSYEPQPFYNGGNTRSQARPEKPLDFHRLQEVLWDGGNFSQQHSTPQQQSTGSVSSRTVSSPRSILKKPKPSPVESQHYGGLSSTPNRAYSYQAPSPYSHNGFHDVVDSPAPRVFELEPAEMEPAEPTPIAPQGYRPETPAFPLRGETPLPYHPFLYSGAELESRTPPVVRAHSSGPLGVRSPSPASQYYAQSRRSSLTSLLEPMDVVHHHPVFVKDTSKYWYKPHISREEAIAVLKDKPPGTFIIRDSNSFPGAFGLALKVATPPPGVQAKTNDGSELVRHFLIEPTAKGVKLKGCNNEPIFGSLAALVYQHSITPLALPSKLLLPEYDPAATSDQIGSAQALLEQGAACNVTYLHSCDTESLTGPEAVRRAVDQALFLAQQKQLTPVSVHFKVSTQGITVTDNTRKLFFRRHYPVNSVTFCGLDPEERRWTVTGSIPVRIFGFVARKIANRTENACHIFAELEPEQPATAIVNFVTKVMMAPLQHQQQRLLE